MAIALRKMSQEEFAAYVKDSITKYAEETQQADRCSKEEALEIARQSFQRLLPNGLDSSNQFLFSIYNGSTRIGSLWFGLKGAALNQKAFVYDIVLSPESRGKGNGKKAMLLFEEMVTELGIKSAGLHVFGHNEIARRLYENLGYRATNILMSKEI